MTDFRFAGPNEDESGAYDPENLPAPAVSVLAGWLAGMIAGRGKLDFDVHSVESSPSGEITVTFGSGLVLRVLVQEYAP